MQAVVETSTFQKSAARAGMTESAVVQLIDYLAANPALTKEIVETYRKTPVRSVK